MQNLTSFSYLSMVTALYPSFERRIDDATLKLIRDQVNPWFFLNTGMPLKLTRFDGSLIEYQGIGFEGSPRHVFWSRYIEPFLEDLAIQQISSAIQVARERGIDVKLLLPEVKGLLLSSCRKVLSKMASADQRLLGKGFLENLPLRTIELEYEVMRQFIEKHINAELQMWRPKKWHHKWEGENKFWMWIIGIFVAIVTMVVKFL